MAPKSLSHQDRLDSDSEELIALARLGSPFTQHAIGKLLSHNSCWGDARYWILISAMGRHDLRAVRQFIVDWKWQDRLPTCEVSKFVPGDHFYALNDKFDTLREAIAHLSERGYRYGGLREKHVYSGRGD